MSGNCGPYGTTCQHGVSDGEECGCPPNYGQPHYCGTCGHYPIYTSREEFDKNIQAEKKDEASEAK